MSGRPKIVLLGMMSKIPVAGVAWQNLHYLLGFERLGFDAYYVEAHARTPGMLMRAEGDDASALASDYIRRTLTGFGLGQRWAYHASHADGRVYGMSERELERLYESAELIVNLHGGTEPRPEHAATGRLVYLETDPVQLQVELYENHAYAVEFLEPHVAFFTFGENYGAPGCELPVDERFRFRPTRQPVVVDAWLGAGEDTGAYTTIGNWSQPWRDVSFGGRRFAWSKDQEFREIPGAAGAERTGVRARSRELRRPGSRAARKPRVRGSPRARFLHEPRQLSQLHRASRASSPSRRSRTCASAPAGSATGAPPTSPPAVRS